MVLATCVKGSDERGYKDRVVQEHSGVVAGTSVRAQEGRDGDVLHRTSSNDRLYRRYINNTDAVHYIILICCKYIP